MNSNLEYEAFMSEIESLIEAKVRDILKNEGFYYCYPATVQKVENDRCSINSVRWGNQSRILNKSNDLLQMNDSVLVMQRYGTAVEDGFIIAKNGGKEM